jgi:MoaA/NifB/PqqE/SkfB family radical SAM enzyme
MSCLDIFGESTPEVKKREESDKLKLKSQKPLVYKKMRAMDELLSSGQPVPQIVLNYDYLCNFQCEHCCSDLFMNKTGKAEKADIKKKLTPEDVSILADKVHEIGGSQFVLSGGEPLTWKKFDDVVRAINPERFYIAIDTNAWFLNKEKALHLKNIGVDKCQISLDSFIEEEHDTFRKRKGSYKRVLEGVLNAKEAGMKAIIMTCLTRTRTYSQEFKDMLDWTKKNEVGLYVTFAKPVGAWENHTEELCGYKEIEYVKDLSKEYDVFTRTSGGHGLNMGCIAVKRSVTVTRYGDVMPCPYIHTSLGNIFKTDFKEILNLGIKLKHFSFGEKRTCLAGNKDEYFVKEYMPKTWGPKDKGIMPLDRVFGPEDYIS